jgi:hypothetical protein
VGTVRVHHEPYPLREVEVASVSEDLLAAAGVERPDAPPVAHFSDGVDVEIRRLIAPAQAPATNGNGGWSKPIADEDRYLTRI